MRLVRLAERLSKATMPVDNLTLAAELDVSVRTVQNDLKTLRSASSEHGFLLLTKRGVGSTIRVSNPGAFDAYLQRLRMGSEINPSELPQLVLQVLAIQTDYVSAESLAQTLGVGRTAIIAVLDKAESLAKEEGFTMERRPHLGVRIKGEFTTRVSFLTTRYANNDCFMRNVVDSSLPDVFFHIACELRHTLAAAGIYVNYPEFNRLLSLIKVLVYMQVNGLGQRDSDDSCGSQEPVQARTSLVFDLISAIQEATDVKLSFAAITYLNEVLCRLTDGMQRGGYELKGEIAHMMGDFLTEWDSSHGTTYMQDNAFRTMLLNHLALLISRLSRNVAYQCAFGEELTITNPSNVDLALLICQRLQECFDVEVTDDEISLVTAHLAAHNERERQNRLRDFARVAVACTTGAGGAYLAKLQFEQIFPVADVRTFSYLDIEGIKSFSPDLVLSMIPLGSSIKAPVIKISEVLSQEEISNINEVISYGELQDGKTSVSQTKIPFRADFFRRLTPSSEINHYTSVVSRMAKELEDCGLAQSGFHDLVLEREQYASTVYLNGVCIPHPMEPVGNQDVVSVCVVEHGLTHGSKEVCLIFLVCLRKEHINMYQPIARRLYALMRNRQLVNRLMSVVDGREFIKVFERAEVNYAD
nr:PTS sugar transporter subunit IIA [Olegusella massiliensis]